MENAQPETPNTTPEPQEEKKTGPMIGIAIIILVLVLGGLYFWGENITENITNDMTPEEILNAPDETLESLETQGTSDEIQDIEADLSATELENLDAEFDDLESELENLL